MPDVTRSSGGQFGNESPSVVEDSAWSTDLPDGEIQITEPIKQRPSYDYSSRLLSFEAQAELIPCQL